MSRLSCQADRLVPYLEQETRSLGFDCFGIADPSAAKLPEQLSKFIDQNYHGSMDWMVETSERRSNPQTLWPDVKSLIMVAMNYGPDFDPLEQLAQSDRGAISVYARNRDYHDVMKGRLKTLASKLLSRARNLGLEGDVKVFVDTAPVMEKPMAMRAGLGWQGKHTNLVSRDFGSWLFLGSIFTTLELTPSPTDTDHCGSCRSCLDICPTNAFPAPYQLDARRCISYLTIENKGPIPLEFRKDMGNRIYGCDDCLAVCPWNKFAQQAHEVKLATVDGYKLDKLANLLQLDDSAFRKRFSGSPVKRIGRDRFIRNCLIAAGNSGNTELVPVTLTLMQDDSPLVRGAAIWALSELAPETLNGMLSMKSDEVDLNVQQEWTTAIEGIQ